MLLAHYVVEYQEATQLQADSAAVTVPANMTKVMLEDLHAGTDYTFSVYAANLLGSSDVVMLLEATVRGWPDPPRVTTGQNCSARTCVLQIDPPVYDGGSRIVRYQVQFLPADMDGNTNLEFPVPRSNQTVVMAARVERLHPNTLYSFCVAGSNEYRAEFGSCSEWYRTHTPTGVPAQMDAPKAENLLGSPSEMNVVWGENGAVLKFDTGGMAITAFVLNVIEQSDNSWHYESVAPDR